MYNGKMINTRSNLIIVKGKVATSSIESIKYNKATKKYDVVFSGNKKYSYAYSNIKWLNNPQYLDATRHQFYFEDKLLYGIEEAYAFKSDGYCHYHLIFGKGYEKSYLHGELKIISSSLNDKSCNDVFEYFKSVAVTEGLKAEDGKNLLSNQLNKIFVSPDSVLGTYINPKSFGTHCKRTINPPIFPFGCNQSQFKAVTAALENRISVIEGPPGTGKTQTILNILANLLILGKTVEVVSNNNSAIQNVNEKMSSYGLDFLVAFLGNTNNKNEFVLSQSHNYPDLSGWGAVNIDEQNIHHILAEKSTQLSKIFNSQERIAEIKNELQGIELEYKYFQEYTKYQQFTRQTISSAKALIFLHEYMQLIDEDKKTPLILRLKNFFIYKVRGVFKLPPEQAIQKLQNLYYVQKINELTNEKKRLENSLESTNATKHIELFTALSYDYLKLVLYNKYGNLPERKCFSKDDLWKNSQEFLHEYPIVLSTTFSAKSSLSKDVSFDYLIMDEASQVDVVTASIAVSMAKNAVIVGDVKQLPNVVTSQTEKRLSAVLKQFDINSYYDYTKYSFLQSLCLLLPTIEKTLLSEHYRCHPKIIDFCNKKFYDNRLIIMTSDLNEDDTLRVVKTAIGNHQRERTSQRQIDVIINEVLPEIDADLLNVGIISPYRDQADLLNSQIKNNNIEIDTVHKFQGRERDVVILTTVDDIIGAFSDDASLINVAVSRAKKNFILVVSGNEQRSDSNISDLVAYISYNNFDIIQSNIYSVFDYLYSQYTQVRIEYLDKHKPNIKFDSEKLMYILISETLNNFDTLKFAIHTNLNNIVKNYDVLTNEEAMYASNPATHVDFLIYNQVSKQPVLAVEVDGYKYHKEGTRQRERDLMKNSILDKINIPYIRFTTNESMEKERLIAKLNEVMK